MESVLIAVSSDILRYQLHDALSSAYAVTSCSDGAQALDGLRFAKPDILILDLMLTGMDGLSLLKAGHRAGLCPKVLVLSVYYSDYILSALERYPVCCAIRLPCDCNYIVSRVEDLAAWRQEKCLPDARIHSILLDLGFKRSVSGYEVTVKALQLWLEAPGQPLSKHLYPQVACILQTSPAQVERAMRLSIENAWKQRNDAMWRAYFPIGRYGKVDKPSNSEFLHRIGSYLQQNDRQKAL